MRAMLTEDDGTVLDHVQLMADADISKPAVYRDFEEFVAHYAQLDDSGEPLRINV